MLNTQYADLKTLTEKLSTIQKSLEEHQKTFDTLPGAMDQNEDQMRRSNLLNTQMRNAQNLKTDTDKGIEKLKDEILKSGLTPQSKYHNPQTWFSSLRCSSRVQNQRYERGSCRP